MKLSIIIPIHNEEKTLEKVVLGVSEVFRDVDHEIVLVDDGSTDNTDKILQNLTRPSATLSLSRRGARGEVIVITHAKNQGKGRAIINALKKASGDLVAIQDADLEYEPKNLYELYKIASKKNRVVYGKRNGESGYLANRLGNKIISWTCSTLFGVKLYDIYTCYKVMPRELAQSLDLQSNAFEIESEITAKILKRKIDILEIPIPYTPRTMAEGKHIRLKDGLRGIWMLIKIKFLM